MIKKFSVIISIFLCFNSIFFIKNPPLQVKGDTIIYGRVLKDNVYLYKLPFLSNENRLFALPVTYFVKVIGEEKDFYIAEYQDNEEGYVKVFGYVQKSVITLYDHTPVSPYFAKSTLSVVSSNSYIYSTPNTQSILASVLIGQEVKYYGKLYDRATLTTYYYVYFLNTFGYVKSSCLSSLNLEMNKEPLPVDSALKDSQEQIESKPTTTTQKKSGSKTKILLAVIILLPCLTMVYFFFHTPSKPNEYERQDRFFGEDDE